MAREAFRRHGSTQLWKPFVSTLLKVVSRVTRNVAAGCLRVFKDERGREPRKEGGRGEKRGDGRG